MDNPKKNWAVVVCDDVWYEILARLPVQTIINCRFACKNWLELTSSDHFIRSHKSDDDPSCPILQSEFNRNNILLYDGSVVRRIDFQVESELYDSVLKCACDGMLCMEAARSHLVFVVNPLTSSYVKLPCFDCSKAPEGQRYGFGFDQSSGKYKVVCGFVDAETRCRRFEIFTLGESSWRQLNAPQNVYWPLLGDAVAWNGSLFWLVCKEVHDYPLLAFDLFNEEFYTISYPYGTESFGKGCKLVVLGESLAVVDSSGLKMRVWKVTGNKVDGFYLLNEVLYDRSVHFSYPMLHLNLKQLRHRSILVRECNSCNGETLLEFFEFKAERDGSVISYVPLNSLQFRPTLVTPAVRNYSGSC